MPAKRGRTEKHLVQDADVRRVVSRPLLVLVLLLLICLSFSSALDSDGLRQDSGDGALDAAPLVVNDPSFVVSPSRVYANEEMTFFLNVTSTLPAATITLTIYFDYYLSDGETPNPDSPVFSTTVSGSTANVMTTHTYTYIGNLSDVTGTYFQVKAFVSDGEEPTALKSLRAYVVENTAPVFSNPPPPMIFADYGVPSSMSFNVTDWDSELVTVTWDFGDGTEPAVNETMATPTKSYIWQNHTWAIVLEPGRKSYEVIFSMSVTFADLGGHVVYSNHTVVITTPDNDAPEVTFVAESSNWSPGFGLPFYASAKDLEGDPLTWTFVFNDTVEDYLVEVYRTDYSEPDTVVWQNISHTYLTPGDYTVTLYLTDALIPYQTGVHNYSQTVRVSIKDNVAPGVLANISVSPPEIRINSTLGYAEVSLYTEVYDSDGDILYLYWDFGDGETATNVSAGGLVKCNYTQVHRYTVAGEYNVTLIVDDDRGHEVLKYVLVSVLTDNRPPTLTLVFFEMSNGVFAAPGSTVNVTISISDREFDPVTLWVDFGDGSPVVRVELSEYSENGTVTALMAHVYNATGKFYVTITYTDWVFATSHNRSVVLKIEVKVARVIVPRVWDWWDYASLILVAVGISTVFVRWFIVGRFRKELDNRGLTLDEYKTMVSELKVERDAALAKTDADFREQKLDSDRAKAMKAEIRADYAGRRKSLRAGAQAGMEKGA